MSPRPIAVDLFSGAGGLSLGFEQAGFDVLAAVEVDPIHAATHKFNFPYCAVIPRSIRSLSAADIRESPGIGGRAVDLVFGGPPCQGFSLIGQRAFDDPRNSLVREFVRIVAELSPTYFLFENVKGLTLGRHRQFLRELVAEFETRGYRVLVPWRVLNAAHYGVPQDRERLFLLGARQGASLPRYPAPTTAPYTDGPDLGLLPLGPSCEDALGDLPDPERFPELAGQDATSADGWGPPSVYARELRCLTDASWHFGYRRTWDPGCLTASATTEHTAISRHRFLATEPGQVEPISRFFRLDRRGIANTLRAGTDSARGAFTSPRPIHYDGNRCITVREMARLHGFPDWFRLHRTKWHGARQVGNAVPPPLARALAGAFIEALGLSPAPPDEVLALGDPSLLALDMTSASAYWGIEVPIGRRDRKSGATKRKQTDIETALQLQGRA